MSAEQDFEDTIIRTIHEHTGKPLNKITPQSYLCADLKLDGDTALEALECLIEKLGLNLEQYDWTGNFPSEGELCSFIYIVQKLFDKHRKFDDLTVEQFVALMRQYLPESSKPA